MIRTLLSTLTAAVLTAAVLTAVLAVAPLPDHTMQASPAAAPPARPAPPGPASWWWRPGTSPARRVAADAGRLPAAGDRPRRPRAAPEGGAPARRGLGFGL